MAQINLNCSRYFLKLPSFLLPRLNFGLLDNRAQGAIGPRRFDMDMLSKVSGDSVVESSSRLGMQFCAPLSVTLVSRSLSFSFALIASSARQ